NALVANVTDEVKLAQAVRILGAEKVKDLEYFQGGDPSVAPDPSIDLSLVDNSILDLYNAFRAPVRFGGSAAEPQAPVEAGGPPEDVGSNNWVVSGRLTQTGFPMMMNDPHRPQSAPSL